MIKLKAKKAIYIVRVSTEEQAKEGHYSLQAQLSNLERYAKDFEVVKKFEFQESAYKGKRKKFKEVLDEIERYDEPVAILVDSIDRLTRELRGWIKLDDLRLVGKIELHEVGKNRVLHKNSPARDLSDWEKDVTYARERSHRTSEDVKRSFRDRYERGKYIGMAPTGYLNVNKKIVLDPKRGPLVKEAFELYATDNYSLMELTRIMRKKGFTVKPKNGKVKGKSPAFLVKSSLNRILGTLFYTGSFEHEDSDTGEKEIIKATNYEPLISKQLYNKVQKILNEKSQRFSTYHSSVKFFKYRGLLRCGFCGSGLTPNDLSTNYKDKKPGEEVYYRCNLTKKTSDPDYYKKKFGTKNCPLRYWREDEIEDEIQSHLGILRKDKKYLQGLKNYLNRKLDDKIKLSEGQKIHLENELKEKEAYRKALVKKMVCEDYPDLAEFRLDMKEELTEVKGEIEGIEGKIKALKDTERLDTDKFVDTLILSSNLKEQFEGFSDVAKRNVTLMAFKSIVVKGKRYKKRDGTIGHTSGMEFEWSEPFWQMLNIGMKKLVPGFTFEEGLSQKEELRIEAAQARAEEAYNAQKEKLNKNKDSL